MRDAALFGVVLGFAALAFLGVLKGGTKLWFTLPKDPGWFDGSLWWVAVTAGAGVLVGVLRHVLRVPAKLPGTLKELKDRRVDPSTAPAAVAVSLVSLVGGASLGPEDALGKMGGGLGTWVSERRKLSEDVQETNALSGMAGAYGGLLASPLLATMLVVEIVRPKARQFADTLVASLLSSSVAAGVATHVLIPALPEGLAFAAMFAGLLGALVAAPFTVIFFAALTTQIGTLQLAPVAIAVLTAYLAVSGTGTLMALANRGRNAARPTEQPARPAAH